jgi:hypothetical protein
MTMRFGSSYRLGAAALATALLAPAAAQAQTPARLRSYAAKFACGAAEQDGDVVRGVYATAVNIHNPLAVPVRITKRALIANREIDAVEQPAGRTSKDRNEILQPQQAIYVDCREIRNLLANPTLTGAPPIPNGHFEGFVVVETRPVPQTEFLPPLNVVGKYTVRPGPTTSGPGVSSIDIEHVPGLELPDLTPGTGGGD